MKNKQTNEIKLKNLRKDIEKANYKILQSLKKRQEIIKQIAIFKKQNNIKTIDKKREKQMFEKIQTQAKELKLSTNYINKLFKLIIKDSREFQKNKNGKY